MERAVEVVLGVATSVLGELDLDALLDRVLEAARELTGARYAAIGVLGSADSHFTGTTELARFITVGIDADTRAAIGALPRGHGMLGELIREPRPLRLADMGAHPRSYGFPDGHPPMRSFLGVPLMVDGAPFGNLYMTEKAGEEHFSEVDEQAAVMLAELAGVAIANARRYTRVRERREELERTVSALQATTEISRAIGGETDLDSILALVAKRGRALVDARLLLVELRDGPGLVVATGAGELPEGLIGQRVALEGTVADQAMRTKRTQGLTDELNRARFEEHGLGASGVHAEDGLVVPLTFRDRTYGVLFAVDRLHDGPRFSREDAYLLEAFAISAATAVATASAVASDLSGLASVVESSKDAILTVDVAGMITSWNKGAELLYGYRAEEMLGTDGGPLLPQEPEPEVLASALSGEESVQRVETVRVRKDGAEVEVSLSSAAIRDSKQRIVGVASSARDVSELKRVNEMLAQTQRLESLGQLAGGVAHDMNNLLAIIINFADFALEKIERQPGAEEVGEIRAAADRAAALVGRLLLFARQDAAGEQELDVNVIVGNLERMLSRTIGEHIALRTELTEQPCPIHADRVQIEQVVMNLALNARDAMSEGGSLTISTANVSLDAGDLPAHAGVDQPRDALCLTVSDTGAGMSRAVLDRVFEPFFTTKPTGSGTGLGLATVYGIVTEANGHVQIDSVEGRGTTVHVFWPAYVRSARPAQASIAAGPSVVEGETILVTEDEEALRAITARILRAAGYEVLTAGLPSEAIELCARHGAAVDMLLTDLVMPEMSGINHIAITVTDLDRSRLWYQEVFGMTTLMEDTHPDGTGYFVLLGNATLSVLVGLHAHPANGGESFAESRTGLDHVGFTVSSHAELEAWEARLTDLGVAHSPINDQASYSVVVFRDPDNIQLEFIALT